MNGSDIQLQKPYLENALRWFQGYFRQALVSPIEREFPGWPFTPEIQQILSRTEVLLRRIQVQAGDEVLWDSLLGTLLSEKSTLPPLFKQIILLYRRYRAAFIEGHTQKTFHLELTGALEEEVKALDALTAAESFLQIERARLPQLKDYLPVQYIESAAPSQLQLQPRQHDEKFHILQAPHLFLPDLGYLRTKCEDRETSLALAFIDIDDFKTLNKQHKETKVDRNLLPRFMQAIEAHVFHHGYAYRQGGDEYLILLPSLSRHLALAFLDELRCRIAQLSYPDIQEKTTVSIGVCVVDPDCPLTDRELLDRANRAKEYAKKQGKNRIATYRGVRFADDDLVIVALADAGNSPVSPIG